MCLWLCLLKTYMIFFSSKVYNNMFKLEIYTFSNKMINAPLLCFMSSCKHYFTHCSFKSFLKVWRGQQSGQPNLASIFHSIIFINWIIGLNFKLGLWTHLLMYFQHPTLTWWLWLDLVTFAITKEAHFEKKSVFHKQILFLIKH